MDELVVMVVMMDGWMVIVVASVYIAVKAPLLGL